MTITATPTLSRQSLVSQGLWTLYDRIEDAGHLQVGIIDDDLRDVHLIVPMPDGSVYKITGYGPDRYTVARFESERAYSWDADADPTHAEAELTTTDVLAVLDERLNLDRFEA